MEAFRKSHASPLEFGHILALHHTGLFANSEMHKHQAFQHNFPPPDEKQYLLG